MLFATGRSAGEITSQAKAELGRGISPWDRLPGDHFVALCSYSDFPLSPVPTPPPDFEGSVFPPEQLHSQYFVDENGRWSEDEFYKRSPDAPAVPATPLQR